VFYPNEIRDPDEPPTREHHHWEDMEEYRPAGGMWAIPAAGKRAMFIEAAERLMADPPSFADAMRRAITEWPLSISVALTTPGLNRRAWLGQAGCFLATGSPEETTRLAWHNLDDGEQYAANAAADLVAHEWRMANPGPVITRPEGLWDA
jgi:hypothetical protein